MFDLVGFIFLSLLGSVFTAVLTVCKKRWDVVSKPKAFSVSWSWWRGVPAQTAEGQLLQAIDDLAECHETAGLLSELIRKDGAGTWPPRSNHAHATWPAPLRAYRDIYNEMAPLLPTPTASLDDDVNRARIARFRSRFEALLDERVDLDRVEDLLKAAEAGRWDVFPRDTYNAFYCCVAWCRHAYRWATIPVVRLAQLERTIHLPPALVLPWTYQQRHFGLTSDSGNNMSNLVLNFSSSSSRSSPAATAAYALRINTGLCDRIARAEESFARVFHEVEARALPVYHAVVHAVLARARGDARACLAHTRAAARALRPLLGSYYDRVHDGEIARDAWLSRVQGFYGWGAGYEVQEEEDGEGGVRWVKFDGLSGNQVLLFQVLDAFLGLPAYLDGETLVRNVPARQRAFVAAVARHSFRAELGRDGVEGMIAREMEEMLKRLRLFRSAHRGRAKVYLSQPAPERLPMTAGKSLLKSDMEQSLEYLDEFMLGRLAQTV